jgi:hypothetical protein
MPQYEIYLDFKEIITADCQEKALNLFNEDWEWYRLMAKYECNYYNKIIRINEIN